MLIQVLQSLQEWSLAVLGNIESPFAAKVLSSLTEWMPFFEIGDEEMSATEANLLLPEKATVVAALGTDFPL